MHDEPDRDNELRKQEEDREDQAELAAYDADKEDAAQEEACPDQADKDTSSEVLGQQLTELENQLKRVLREITEDLESISTVVDRLVQWLRGGANS